MINYSSLNYCGVLCCLLILLKLLMMQAVTILPQFGVTLSSVPISTQWGSQGYYYPIQIAQYGLSHYSKYLLDTTRVMSVLEDGESGSLGMWQFTSSSLRTVFDKERNTNILEFNTHESVTSAGVKINLDSTTLFFLSLHIKLRPNASCTVVVETKARANDVNSKLFSINYISDSVEVFRVERQNIYYGIGDRTEWTWFVRDISLDLQKALANRAGNGKGRKKAKFDVTRLVSLSFHGVGRVDNITLANNAHLDQFMAAADWLVTHQDINGGWPIMVTRKLANDMLELPPGWYSAMAQGQAMSVLVRAFTRTKDRRYLNAALHATKLFDIKSADGGVLAKFADKYAWYEEYPTVPSCFVLNGFIYSLIGLYDLKTIASSKDGLEASRLYSQGFESLKALLLLYDTGSGTIYDLRHFTLGLAPNIARWDYHTTHINQLLLLATVEDSELLQNTAKRWIGYMKGHRAAHN